MYFVIIENTNIYVHKKMLLKCKKKLKMKKKTNQNIILTKSFVGFYQL